MYTIKLNNTEIPSIPFLWYREQQLTCPIDKIEYNEEKKLYVITQTNVLNEPTTNLYICLHTILFSTLYPNLINIPSDLNMNTIFTTNIVDKKNIHMLNNCGSVHIHDSAFSPCGTHCFKLIDPNIEAQFLCNILCDDPKINIDCLFIILPPI